MAKNTAKPAKRRKIGADIARRMDVSAMSRPVMSRPVMSRPAYDMSHLRYRRDVYGNDVLDEDDQEDGENPPKAVNPA